MNQQTKSALITFLELYLAELKEAPESKIITVLCDSNQTTTAHTGSHLTSTGYLTQENIDKGAYKLEEDFQKGTYGPITPLHSEPQEEIAFTIEVHDSEFILPQENVKKNTKKKK